MQNRAVFLLLLRAPSHHLAFFFFNDTATTEIYTLSLHDALPISTTLWYHDHGLGITRLNNYAGLSGIYLIRSAAEDRSEEHTSELQSQSNLVCRLLLEKKRTM